MKIVKVKIRRGGVGEDMMTYPSPYNAQEVDRSGIGPCGINGTGAYSGGIGRGQDHEFCLILLEDDVASKYLESSDMEEITAHEADVLMEQWRIDNDESEEVVRDPARIQAVAVKQAAGFDLTQEDLDAIDPTKSTPGINKRLRSMASIVAKTGKTLTPKGR